MHVAEVGDDLRLIIRHPAGCGLNVALFDLIIKTSLIFSDSMSSQSEYHNFHSRLRTVATSSVYASECHYCHQSRQLHAWRVGVLDFQWSLLNFQPKNASI